MTGPDPAALAEVEEPLMRFVGWSVESPDGESCYGTFPTRDRADSAARWLSRGNEVKVVKCWVPDELANLRRDNDRLRADRDRLSAALRAMARRAGALRKEGVACIETTGSRWARAYVEQRAEVERLRACEGADDQHIANLIERNDQLTRALREARVVMEVVRGCDVAEGSRADLRLGHGVELILDALHLDAAPVSVPPESCGHFAHATVPVHGRVGRVDRKDGSGIFHWESCDVAPVSVPDRPAAPSTTEETDDA